jgi:hypothetical protein
MGLGNPSLFEVMNCVFHKELKAILYRRGKYMDSIYGKNKLA